MSIEDKEFLQEQIASLFADNNSRDISAEDLRDHLLEALDSQQLQRQSSTLLTGVSQTLTEAQIDQNRYHILQPAAGQTQTFQLPAITEELIGRAMIGYTDYTDQTATFVPDGSDIIIGNNPLEAHKAVFALRVLSGNTWTIATIILDPHYTVWRNIWENGLSYQANEMVRDGEWTMIANTLTIDRPAPVDLGAPEYVLGTTPGWSDLNNTSVIHSGHIYTFTTSGWIRRLRVWVPALTVTTNYRVIISDLTDPLIPIVYAIEEPVLLEDAWTEIRALNQVIPSGTILSIILDSLDSAAVTNWDHPWLRQSGALEALPVPGSWTRSNNSKILWINTLDNDAVNQSTDLDAITLDSLIRIQDAATPTTHITYRVEDIVSTPTSYYQFGISIHSQNNNGPAVGTLCDLIATIPVPSSTEYVQLAAQWPGSNPSWATLEGVLEFNGVDQAETAAAFGVDIQFVEAEVSEDWDFVAKSEV